MHCYNKIYVKFATTLFNFPHKLIIITMTNNRNTTDRAKEECVLCAEASNPLLILGRSIVLLPIMLFVPMILMVLGHLCKLILEAIRNVIQMPNMSSLGALLFLMLLVIVICFASWVIVYFIKKDLKHRRDKLHITTWGIDWYDAGKSVSLPWKAIESVEIETLGRDVALIRITTAIGAEKKIEYYDMGGRIFFSRYIDWKTLKEAINKVSDVNVQITERPDSGD